MTEICKHNSFEAQTRVTKLVEEEDSEIITGYRIDVTVNCAECGSKFQFIGLPQGYNHLRPTLSADNLELRCPIEISI